MAGTQTDPKPIDYKATMSLIYREEWRKCFDIVGRNDFYGVTGQRCTEFLSQKMGLSGESRVLDLCCGIGGPARFLARHYGCSVTGVDVSEYNCRAFREKARNDGLDSLIDVVEHNVLEMEPAAEGTTVQNATSHKP